MTDRHSEAPPLLVVGSAARDIDGADPRGWRLGGTVMYAALTAAKLGVRVRTLVGADEQAAGAHELELLREVGAEVELVRLEHGPVFRNQQTPAGRVQYGHQASDPIPLSAVPERWRATPAVLLGPVSGEIGVEWAEFDRGAFMALAGQGLLREIVPGERVHRLPLMHTALLDRADLVLISNEDLSPGGARLGRLLHEGGRLAVTHGSLGALSLRLYRGGRLMARMMPALPPRRTVDETGAGDVFLAGLCAGRLLAGATAWANEEWRVFALAAAAASVSVEGVGLEAVPDLAAVCGALVRLRATSLVPPIAPED